MVDTRQVLALVTHYVAMLVLAVIGVTLARVVLPDLPSIGLLFVVLLIVGLYPFMVRRLGYAPGFWE